jgi:arginyl-tRNA synthetase
MVEYSSPNTNKPLHLGHIRNNLLGFSVAKLLEANGHNVMKVNLVNDRGIHICKSMYAWKVLGNGETPASSGKKGDHLVGDYYVAFNNLYKKEVDELVAGGMSKEEAEKNAPSLKAAQEMLFQWENGNPEVVELWKTMNGWVYEGFDKTYNDLGICFDRTYYESQTYLFGKALVQAGLEKGIFETEADGSVWCDLTSDGLDRKLLLRGDGTSVYMTQDLGTAEQRFSEYSLDEHIYVVGNEQNYHFQVLKLILGKLGFDWAKSIYHLSYGMVELPEGKMKSREGTVVDADDLILGMYNTAKETSLELGKIGNLSEQEQDELFKMISLGALKYFILKVDPRKTMLFDPKESIDFNGNTGPFIQYTHARIRSILRKADEQGFSHTTEAVTPEVLPPSSSQGKGDFSLPPEAISGVIDITRQIVDAKRDIATIEANSAAKIREMEKEIERITVETRNYIDKLEAESKGWHSRFDKRRAFSEKVLAEIGRHPEWSDAVCEKVIDLVKSTMEL